MFVLTIQFGEERSGDKKYKIIKTSLKEAYNKIDDLKKKGLDMEKKADEEES